MSKRKKKLEKWANTPPKEAPVEEVCAIVEYFFPGLLKNQPSGSHFRVKDPALRGHPDYGPDGGFDIPVKSGQKVKGVYLRLLARAIELKESHEQGD